MRKRNHAYPVLINDVLGQSFRTSEAAYWELVKLIPNVDREEVHSLSQVRRIIQKKGFYEFRSSNHLNVKIQQLILQ